MANTKKQLQNSTPFLHTTSPLASVNTEANASIAQAVSQQFARNISAHILPHQQILVGLSGGLDSCVLLHLFLNYYKNNQNQQASFALSAMHVHHGISQHADAWALFCQSLCHAYQIPFQAVQVKLNKQSKLGIEAEARMLRYQALLQGKHDWVAVAHHQDDQAETLLLQLLRGAGVRGLASMAAHNAQQRLLRPLLNISKADLEAYARYNQLQWVEDESNMQQDYDRNFLRHSVLPLINSRYPQAQKTLARAAAHLAEALQLQDDLAQIDAEQCILNQMLVLNNVSKLSVVRQKNLVRWWLQQQAFTMPSASKLDEILQQLLAAKADANLQVVLDSASGMTIRRHQGLAYIVKQAKEGLTQVLIWQGEETLTLPDQTTLKFSYAQGQGLDIEQFNAPLNVRYRMGGERFKPHATRPTRTLKHLLQEADMPPSMRERLPLIYAEDTLLMVPTIGVAAQFQASAHKPGLVVEWIR